MIRIHSRKHSDSLSTMRTDGLQRAGHPELEVEFDDSQLADAAEDFLYYVSNYLQESGRRLCPGETMAFGYWLTKFQDAGPGALETWEYDTSATDFIRGASLALRYWKDQHAVCKRYGADFQPPRPDKLTVISNGVLEGLPVQGVRYPSPDHMSGWWITTDQYDGNIESLKHEHTYHVTAARPDLAQPYPMGIRSFSASLPQRQSA